jgi:catechol 2,3-dioxygenase-like lactoylglutathione lyase family enzyme
MSLLHVEGVTHWSIPVNNLEESEAFYGELLGLPR